MPRTTGLFIVGTDTEVGKTYVAAAIARSCAQRGLRVRVYKPVLSGWQPEQREQADDWLLWDAAGRPGTLDEVCPQRFRLPVAPPLAAAAEDCEVDEALLVQGFQAIARPIAGQSSQPVNASPQDLTPDLVLVEGAGGLMSPISKHWFVADLAEQLRLPLIVVAPNRLGVINHTLQTLITAATFRDGLPVAGIVLSDVEGDGATADQSTTSNADQLRKHCVAPLLAHVTHGDPSALDAVDWVGLARRLDWDAGHGDAGHGDAGHGDAGHRGADR